MEFTTWSILGTYAGSLAMVLIITQITKNVAVLQKTPTQVWSYIVALFILLLAEIFSGAFSLEAAALCLFNAAVVALGANGGYEAIARVAASKKDGDERT